MLAYPKALRIRVVNAVEQGEGTIAEISTLFAHGSLKLRMGSEQW
jgi:hypothetical protein